MSTTTTSIQSQVSSDMDHHDDDDDDGSMIVVPHNSRRSFMKNVLVTMATTPLMTLARPKTSSAASSSSTSSPEEELPTREFVVETFAPIKFELNDPQGGVSYIQGRIDQQDWDGLMEFTKTYDLELRKKLMGRAKKLLQSKEVKNDATTFANGVTFDLIGINRSSRKGQENVDAANRYLQELRDDVSKFLSLESTIQVQ